MNPFESLFWMGAIYFLLLAINRNRPKLLFWTGVLLGLGLENKHSTAFFLIALFMGILATSGRSLLRSRWLWLAVGITLLLCLPNLIWQYMHGFPTWVDLNNVRRIHKNVDLAPVAFVMQQIMALLPSNALVWIAGLGFLLFHRGGKPYRVLAATFLAFFLIMMALHGKDYYLAPIYPMMFAAGGVFWQKLIESHRKLRWIKVALPIVQVVVGVIVLPIVLPILPPDRIDPYMQSLGIGVSHSESHMTSDLPQHFADEFGWPEMVAQVAGVYNNIPPAERADTAVLAENYGSAGAIDFFGPRFGLPQSISAHQNYFYWGPRQYTGKSIILLNWRFEDAQSWCQSVEEGPKVGNPFAMGWEHYTILICHGLKKPLAEAWPKLKVWD